MLGLLPVYLNARTGDIFLASDPVFKIEPKVVYEMSPCELKHLVPDPEHDCGIITSLDLDEMKRFIAPKGGYNSSAVPAIAVFQVTGRTIFDKTTKTLRSRGIYYYGMISDDIASTAYFAKTGLSMYAEHARYRGAILPVWQLLEMMTDCGFNLVKCEGKIFAGYSRYWQPGKNSWD